MSATAVMWAVGLNNVTFWAALFFLLTFIPNIGVTVGSNQIALEAGRSLHLHQPLHISSVVGSISVAQVARFVLSGMRGLLSGLLLMIVYFGFMLAGRKRNLRVRGSRASP